jgi:kynurenine formamidase
MKIIDLSHTIESSPQDLPDFLRVDVSYSDHQAGAREFHDVFGIPPRLFRNGEGPAGERLSIGTHAGTHLDAPYHYMGIDAWGWDAPLDGQASEALERDEPGIFWAAHQVDLPYSQIERLTNLAALPPTGFTVACFPLKIKGASAGLSRVVAIVGA